MPPFFAQIIIPIQVKLGTCLGFQCFNNNKSRIAGKKKRLRVSCCELHT
uniref:LOS4 n=1 Tax=Rhizophora mucronata TaxID=61149 RepID=A0A2P2JR67_RHIMU